MMTEREAELALRERVYDALTREDNYAQGWAVGGKRKQNAYTSIRTGMPYSEIEWITFAEKYLNEAKAAYANYTPDRRALYSRMLKAASLLVSGLQSLASEQDLIDVAGVSSTNFPVFSRGLKDLQEALAKDSKGTHDKYVSRVTTPSRGLLRQEDFSPMG